jgi:hypothetical protein
VTGQWISPGNPVSSTNKTDRHVRTEILLNGIKDPNPCNNSIEIGGRHRNFISNSNISNKNCILCILIKNAN